MASNLRKRMLDLAMRVPAGASLRFEVPLASLRSPNGVIVTGEWTVSLIRDGEVVIARSGATGEDALEAVELDL